MHGTTGSLTLGDPNGFDGVVRRHQPGVEAWRRRPAPVRRVGRPRDRARRHDRRGIRAGRPHRASGALAFHVLDVLLSLEAAVGSGRRVAIGSTVERPAAGSGSPELALPARTQPANCFANSPCFAVAGEIARSPSMIALLMTGTATTVPLMAMASAVTDVRAGVIRQWAAPTSVALTDHLDLP